MEPSETDQTIIADSEIFDIGIKQRLNAMFVSMGLQFCQDDMKFYLRAIPLFIQDV